MLAAAANRDDEVEAIQQGPRELVAERGAAGAGPEFELGAKGVVGVSPGASIEDKIAFLLRRDEQTQNDVSELRQRLAALESETPNRLDELRSSLEAYFAAELKRSQELFRFGS